MEDNWLVKKAYNIATHQFHKWYGLLSSVLLLIVFSLLIYDLIPESELAFKKYALGVGILAFIVIGSWILTSLLNIAQGRLNSTVIPLKSKG